MKKGSLLPFILFACSAFGMELEIDSPRELYFKKAQESFAYRDYKAAISIYELFLERYPHDLVNVYTARYEIGYAYYRSRQYNKAIKKLTDLLRVPDGVPNWIPVLSQRVLDTIELKKNPLKKKKNPKEEEGSKKITQVRQALDPA